MAAYPTAWGFSSLKSPEEKGVEVESLLKSGLGALGPARPHPTSTPALGSLDQTTEPSGLQSSLRHENLSPAPKQCSNHNSVHMLQGAHGTPNLTTRSSKDTWATSLKPETAQSEIRPPRASLLPPPRPGLEILCCWTLVAVSSADHPVAPPFFTVFTPDD